MRPLPAAPTTSAAGTTVAGDRTDECWESGMSKTFVFVDERVEDRRTLLAGLPPGSRWVIVDDREHGLRQSALPSMASVM
jgi:hypothetical protein